MERNESVEFFKNSDLRDVYTDSACDHSMPDYKGDVKRVLHTSATVIPSGRFMDNSELCFSGVVAYKVVYLNSENKIEGEEFTSDYDFTVKYPTDHAVDFSEKTRIASTSVRLTGPRKFSAKCSLVSNVCVTERLPLETVYNVGNEPVELSRECVAALVKRAFYSGEREYAEKLHTFDGAIADDVSVITSCASVIPSSVTRAGEDVCVKGNIVVDYVVANGDIPPYSERKPIPFEERIRVEDLTDSAVLHATGRVVSLKLNVNPEDFGTNITADVITELCLDTAENRETTLACDGYVISCDSEPNYEMLSYNELVATPVLDESVEASVKNEELGLGALRDIIFIGANPRIEDALIEENNITVKGEMRFSGIASERDENDVIAYSGFKYSAPFVLNVNCDLQKCTKLSVEPEIEVSNVNALIDKDSIALSCDVRMNGMVTETKEMRRLVSLDAVPESRYDKSPSRITVYYPDKNEDLFSIAKTFHTTVKDIAVFNSLTESVINDLGKSASVSVKKLMIK